MYNFKICGTLSLLNDASREKKINELGCDCKDDSKRVAGARARPTIQGNLELRTCTCEGKGQDAHAGCEEKAGEREAGSSLITPSITIDLESFR